MTDTASPAATEIVNTASEGAALERPPLIILDSVRQFFDDHGLGSGAITAKRIGAGSSNATFLIERGPNSYVLRRPPLPPLPPSAHDVVREARLQLALGSLGVRVPHVLAVCESDELLGVPFYVMEHVDGQILTRHLVAPIDSTEQSRTDLMEDFIAALVEIHAADLSSPGLAPFVRAGDYLERQLQRFSRLWDHNATREIPEISELYAWLRSSQPPPIAPVVVHGDYRLGNVMIGRPLPARVLVVLDWELGAVGDPRADLGYMLATYSDGTSHGTVLELTPVTAAAGFPDRREMVASYVRRSGREVGNLDWFEALALWKAAVFCEAIYSRYLRGEFPGDRFAASLAEGVPELIAAAARIAEAA